MDDLAWLDEHRAQTVAMRDEAARLLADRMRLHAQFEQTRRAVRATRDQIELLHAAAAGTVRATRDSLKLLRSAPPVPAETAAPAPYAARDPLDAILDAVGVEPDDLHDLTDALIAAHRKAEATEDEEIRAASGDVLRLIGRHLAIKLGPKAAGVTMN